MELLEKLRKIHFFFEKEKLNIIKKFGGLVSCSKRGTEVAFLDLFLLVLCLVDYWAQKISVLFSPQYLQLFDVFLFLRKSQRQDPFFKSKNLSFSPLIFDMMISWDQSQPLH